MAEKVVQTFYKIKHLPTGLFFRPYSSCGDSKNKTGKVYQKKPSLSYLGNKLRTGYRTYEDVVLSEWKIITYKVIEVDG